MEDVITTPETPVDTTVDDSVETTTTDESAGETPESGSEEGGSAHSGEPPTGSGTETGLILDGKRLSEAAKATLAEIKAKDPKLAAQIKSALFSADALKRALPGGIKEVGELRQQIQDLGGPEGIQAIRAEQQQWQALDEQFSAGDPKFVESIAAESPEAFQKLAPAVFQKFQELNPDGFSSYVSQVFVSDMVQQGIPLALERLQDFIGDNPKAQEIWQKLAGYVNRVNGFAQKPVTAPAKKTEANPQIDERERAINERETAFTRNEWRTGADSERMSVFNAEFSRLTSGRKLSDTQTAAIKELYVSRLQAALRKTPDFNKNVDRYFANKDREGYLRYISSIYKQEIPKALRSAVDSVLPAKPGPAAGTKPAAPAAAANGKTAAQAAAAAAQNNGFTWVAAAPKPDQLDRVRTTTDMIRQGKAVLLDGKRVQWKK